MKKQVLKTDGRNIEYFKEGRGIPIVLLPGLSCNCSLWQRVVPILARQYEVYAFSLPLYGTRNNQGHIYTLRTLPMLLGKIFRMLDIQHPVLGGHSLGSLVALSYAAQHLHGVRKLVMVSSPLSSHSRPIPYLWQVGVDFALRSKRSSQVVGHLLENQILLDHLLKVAVPDKNLNQSPERIHKLLTQLPIKYMAKCYHDLFAASYKDELELVKTPMLFVHGSQDEVLNIFGGTELYNTARQSQVECLNCGHFVPSDRPKDLAHLIDKFIQS